MNRENAGMVVKFIIGVILLAGIGIGVIVYFCVAVSLVVVKRAIFGPRYFRV